MKKHNHHNWKNELRDRSIKPSEEAWLAIEAGLENKSKSNLKKKFAYLLVAATLIGFLITLGLSFTQVNHPENSISVEDQETKLQESKSNTSPFIEQEPEINTQLVTKPVQNQNGDEDKVQASSQSFIDKVPTKLNSANREIGETNSLKASLPKKKGENNSQNTNISPKALELLAEVEAELAGKSSSSINFNAEDEADLLLAEAQQVIQEVDYKKLYEVAKANDLLAEVESNFTKQDLQQRVWRFVKTNYHNLENTLASLK